MKIKHFTEIICKVIMLLFFGFFLFSVFRHPFDFATILSLLFCMYLVFVCWKPWKPFAYRRVLFLLLGIFLFSYFLPHIDHAGRFDDVVMVDNELYFVLGKEQKIAGVRVEISTSTIPVDDKLVMWGYARAGNDKYLKTSQIKYGQEIDGFRTWKPLRELKKNVKYVADIGVAGAAFPGNQIFTITDDNKVIMTTRRFDPERPKNHTVIIERNGQKITIPYSVSFDKDGHKVIVSEPIPRK